MQRNKLNMKIKSVRVKIYVAICGDGNRNLIFNEEVPVWSENRGEEWDVKNLIDLFNPSIFNENTRLEIKIEEGKNK